MTGSGSQRYLVGALPLCSMRPEPQAWPSSPSLSNQPLWRSSQGRRVASRTGFSCSGSGLEVTTVPSLGAEDWETALSGSSGHMSFFVPVGWVRVKGGWSLTSGTNCRERV